MSKQTLLIEIGTEELPPKSLKKLSDAFSQGMLEGLLDCGLISSEELTAASSYATPRRLALSVPNTAVSQPDQHSERRGPAVQAAFNDAGEATPAAIGFAKSCGLAINELGRTKTDKGEWLSASITEQGKPLSALLSSVVDAALKRLPIPKRMRWGNGTAEFVRPVKWVTVMHGAEIVPIQILDVAASNTTRGHRFHSQGDLEIKHADDYQDVLTEQGHVVADFQQRQAMILSQTHALATAAGGHIEEDQSLLDEVTGLVEYPTAILGAFDPAFLEVPQECLISSMRDHQKYFHIVDADGKLLPKFITVSNIQSSNPEQVRSGNEKVLRARLSDAQFFWQTDQKVKLENRVERLDSVLFHVKLGSVLDKTKRIQKLAGLFAADMNADVDVAQRGAYLAKADLASDMVGEFDELQGIMGHYYADRDGEAELVGACIEQHYWPKFAGDDLPLSAEAQAVALADKLDSLVGIYAAGEVPTGDKDPYALRRAALSVLRILIECEHEFEIPKLVSNSAQVYQENQDFAVDADTQRGIVDFIRGRLMAFYQAQSIDTSSINSVMACSPNSPLDFDQRVKAVAAFRQAPEATDLAAANKRISNILRKQTTVISDDIDEAALEEPAEKQLLTAINQIEAKCNALFDAGDYQAGLGLLAGLRSPIDEFFEHVMVMTEDPAQQQNRLSLLKRIQDLFLRVADIARLQN
ncbi:glycine--tRNA ligase subunit beta [Arenicella xantha]|uniref:Glycine--tRNA ligase beta subunit n=1 Tax=Arenicella xantha TaxID=644221 RepID=A0A395JUT4_9GAMM|nr:glycine--tRNA ligase subunit beta [Arenicella xantha]RBP53318.1 glycyl-tRNA synthetase beta chain [Arenicella xantha]